jgi:hypothetical protein
MRKKHTILFLVPVGLLAIIGVFFMLQPQDNTITDEQKVMEIAVAYIEETYGNNYILNGEVSNHSFIEHRQEGDIVYNYPTASFRIPADYQEPGQLVSVMVNPDTEEIKKVVTQPSKSMPSPSPH